MLPSLFNLLLVLGAKGMCVFSVALLIELDTYSSSFTINAGKSRSGVSVKWIAKQKWDLHSALGQIKVKITTIVRDIWVERILDQNFKIDPSVE